MIKKTISVMAVIAMVFSATVTANAQEDKSYKMWENIMLTPDNTKLKILSENMRKHNAQYHKAAPYNATVYNIVSGPNSGKIIWQMGPMHYKHNDTRPSEGGHDDDWRDNVMPYIKKIHTIEYWTQDDKLSNTSMLQSESIMYPLLFVRVGEIEKNQVSSVNQFYKYVSETVKAMEGANPWGLYYNEFRQGNLGRHVASVSFYKNWTAFDEEENTFKKTFEKVHGEENWQMFLDMADRTFKDSWDEIWMYNKHMSGH